MEEKGKFCPSLETVLSEIQIKSPQLFIKHVSQKCLIHPHHCPNHHYYYDQGHRYHQDHDNHNHSSSQKVISRRYNQKQLKM